MKKYDRTLGSKREQGIITPKAPQNRPKPVQPKKVKALSMAELQKMVERGEQPKGPITIEATK